MNRLNFAVFADLVAVWLIVAMGGCVGDRSSHRSRWDFVDAKTDSISAVIDSCLFNRVDTAVIDREVAAYDSLVATIGETPELTGRARYFKAFSSRWHMRFDESSRILAETLETTDSAKYPYLYHRLLYLDADTHEPTVENYDFIVSEIDFYHNRGDDFMEGVYSTDLSNLLAAVHDTEGALTAYHKADSLYRKSGYTRIADYNRVNYGELMLLKGDTAGAVSHLRELARDSVMHGNRAVLKAIYGSLYQLEANREWLDSIVSVESYGPMTLRTQVMLARELLNDGDENGASELIGEALRRFKPTATTVLRAEALDISARVEANRGNYQSAYRQKCKADSIMQVVTAREDNRKIREFETGRMLESRRLEAQIADSRRTLRLTVVGFLLLILIAISGWYIWKKIKRLRAERAETAAERDSVAQKLVATQIAMEETETLISNVEKEIGSKTDDGLLPQGETRGIINALKIHNVKARERDDFIETFMLSHPDFARKMLSINPEFTESDIRLAGMITMGLDTVRVAATLGIRPKSVKQARYRLRTKLGLQRGDSLEERLRSLL